MEIVLFGRELYIANKESVIRGHQLFNKASMKYSASAIPQGAYIALECRKSNEDPDRLWTDFVMSRRYRNKSIETANSVHLQRGKDVKIDGNYALGVINNAFRNACEMKDLTDEQLINIGNQYDLLKSEGLTYRDITFRLAKYASDLRGEDLTMLKLMKGQKVEGISFPHF